jgi:hypothetical protein
MKYEHLRRLLSGGAIRSRILQGLVNLSYGGSLSEKVDAIRERFRQSLLDPFVDR